MKTIKKMTLGTLLGVAAFSTFSLTQTKKTSIETVEESKVIRNNHEWDQLQEVVVGRWETDTFIIPEVNNDLKAFFPYITEESFRYMKAAKNQSLFQAYPDDDNQYHEETENLVSLFEELGVKVRRPDELEYDVEGTSQVYSRDPIITIGNKFIIANMYTPQRRQETPSYRRIALDLSQEYEGQVISMPANKPGLHKDNAYLEGGDVFVSGKEIFVGISGNASNKKGVEWLQKELGDEYTVHIIPLKSNVLHLDCAMMLINEHQGIICPEGFLDFESIPSSLKNRDWVTVKPEEAQVMATNGVVVNSRTIILTDAFPHVAHQIRDTGIKVYEIPYQKSNYFGGGLRCSYQPINRK